MIRPIPAKQLHVIPQEEGRKRWRVDGDDQHLNGFSTRDPSHVLN